MTLNSPSLNCVFSILIKLTEKDSGNQCKSYQPIPNMDDEGTCKTGCSSPSPEYKKKIDKGDNCPWSSDRAKTECKCYKWG